MRGGLLLKKIHNTLKSILSADKNYIFNFSRLIVINYFKIAFKFFKSNE